MNKSRVFALGQCLATQGVLRLVSYSEIYTCLERHRMGDWGDVEAEDRAANDAALVSGARLLSSFISSEGVHLWIITEADRSATTVLLPSEY